MTFNRGLWKISLYTTLKLWEFRIRNCPGNEEFRQFISIHFGPIAIYKFKYPR